MYQVSVEQHFDAAHYLRGYQGKCEALHGHRFKVVATVSASELDDTGMAYDFTLLKRHLADILSRFDHTCINDVPPFDKLNPSSENIAAEIYQALDKVLSDAAVRVVGIEVWESPESRVFYQPDGA